MSDGVSNYWAYFYNQGFFGFGNPDDFKIGSFAHIIPILLLLVAIFLIYKYRNVFKNNSKLDKRVTEILIIIMIFSELSYWWRLVYAGPGNDTVHNLLGRLPIQVCQWTLLITVCGMICKSEDMIGVSFFMASVPSLLAIIYPSVLSRTGPSYFRYYQYWFEHIIPVISVYYMLFVHNYKVKFKHLIYSLLILTLLYYVGSKANVLLDKNVTTRYLYMNYMRKIPILANTNDLELYFVCIILIFIAFYIIYRIYKYITNKHNEENTMD